LKACAIDLLLVLHQDVLEAHRAEARAPVLDHAADALGQGGEGGVGVREERVAAIGRDLQRVEKRSRIGDGLVLPVGVPAPPGPPEPDGLAVLLDVRDDEDLRPHR
jgi:hypothetical protein